MIKILKFPKIFYAEYLFLVKMFYKNGKSCIKLQKTSFYLCSLLKQKNMYNSAIYTVVHIRVVFICLPQHLTLNHKKQDPKRRLCRMFRIFLLGSVDKIDTRSCNKKPNRSPVKQVWFGKEPLQNKREATFAKKSRRERYSVRGDVVEHRGFEPLTSTLPVWRAPNCANAPKQIVLPFYYTSGWKSITNFIFQN